MSKEDVKKRISDLKNELQNKEIELEELEVELHKLKRPQPMKKIDWSKVIKMCEDENESIQNGNYNEDNDNDIWLAEEVYTTIYGNDYYKWRNERT